MQRDVEVTQEEVRKSMGALNAGTMFPHWRSTLTSEEQAAVERDPRQWFRVLRVRGREYEYAQFAWAVGSYLRLPTPLPSGAASRLPKEWNITEQSLFSVQDLPLEFELLPTGSLLCRRR